MTVEIDEKDLVGGIEISVSEVEGFMNEFNNLASERKNKGPLPDFLKSNDLHVAGAKDDSGKVLAEVLADFSRSLKAVAEVGSYGANKYTRKGWEVVADGEQRYKDALWRHLLEDNITQIDPESGLPHLYHAAWNILAVLELQARKSKA